MISRSNFARVSKQNSLTNYYTTVHPAHAFKTSVYTNAVLYFKARPSMNIYRQTLEVNQKFTATNDDLYSTTRCT